MQGSSAEVDRHTKHVPLGASGARVNLQSGRASLSPWPHAASCGASAFGMSLGPSASCPPYHPLPPSVKSSAKCSKQAVDLTCSCADRRSMRALSAWYSSTAARVVPWKPVGHGRACSIKEVGSGERQQGQVCEQDHIMSPEAHGQVVVCTVCSVTSACHPQAVQLKPCGGHLATPKPDR